MLVEKLDNYDVVLLQETWITNSAGRKERLVAAARKRGFGFWVRSACRGDPFLYIIIQKLGVLSIPPRLSLSRTRASRWRLWFCRTTETRRPGPAQGMLLNGGKLKMRG